MPSPFPWRVWQYLGRKQCFSSHHIPLHVQHQSWTGPGAIAHVPEGKEVQNTCVCVYSQLSTQSLAAFVDHEHGKRMSQKQLQPLHLLRFWPFHDSLDDWQMFRKKLNPNLIMFLQHECPKETKNHLFWSTPCNGSWLSVWKWYLYKINYVEVTSRKLLVQVSGGLLSLGQSFSEGWSPRNDTTKHPCGKPLNNDLLETRYNTLVVLSRHPGLDTFEE